VHHAVVLVVPHRDNTEFGVPHAPKQKRNAAGVAVKRIERDDRLRSPLAVEAIYVPGASLMDYRLHHAAKLIPAGADLLIQMHYTPNGTATTDRTSIGFRFAKEAPARRFVTVNATALRDRAHFHIPAGDPDWETQTEVVFNQDAEIVWFMPHMHLRGKDMTIRVIYPSGESETLLSVPHYDFHWQIMYYLKKPLLLPRGTRVEVTAHWDNSAANPQNPDPTAAVRYGVQNTDEMLNLAMNVVVDPD
jgi:hypothetical protein